MKCTFYFYQWFVMFIIDNLYVSMISVYPLDDILDVTPVIEDQM